MFNCSACLRRAIKSLSKDLSKNEQPLLSKPAPRTSPAQRSRPFSSTPISRTTLRALSKGHHRRTYIEARRDLAKERRDPFKGAVHIAATPSNTRRNKARELPVDRRNRHAVENNQKHLLTSRSERSDIEIAAAKEAEWINDPLRLAERVLTYLRQGSSQDGDGDGYEKALELVRAAERHSIKQGAPQGAFNSIVSWNHLMDFCMYKGDPKSAYKIFNELKKRGHKPDAHTYTIMLKGYSDNASKAHALNDALRVYESISAHNSDVKPNTIHLNAALGVCARAGDMDSLWSLVGKGKERGPGSADATTYTIILNAIQKDIIKRTAQILGADTNADVSKVFDTAVNDGRRVWSDVVMKWRAGEINVDENLACAMGRLLLMSKKMKDVMDVFKLVQQTMNIEIPLVPIQRLSEPQDPHDQPSPEDEQVMEVFGKADWIKQKPVGPIEGPAKALYAKPGTNTLSMLLEAATVTKQMHIGKAYWDLLVETEKGSYNIPPDHGNITAYLRLLRVSRSSRTALEVLRRDWPEHIESRLYNRGNFVIAMSTCVRDKNNPNVFETASRILDIMQEKADKDQEAALKKEEEAANRSEHLGSGRRDRKRRDVDEEFKGETLELDPKIMTMYLNLAMWTTKGIAESRLNPQMTLKKLRNGDLDFERNPSKNNTFRALKRLGPTIVNVKRMMTVRLAEVEKQALSPRERVQMNKKNKHWVDYNKTQERLEDLVGLFKGMISAYDRVLSVNWKLEDEGMGPLDGEWLEEVKLNKAKLSTYVNKIDRKVMNQMKLGRTGLWEGYDPALQPFDGDPKALTSGAKTLAANPDEPDTSYGSVDREGRLIPESSEEGEELVPSDLTLHRTPGTAKLNKEVTRRVKTIETQRENAKRWLSRRQRQEKEKARREDRKVGFFYKEEVERRFGARSGPTRRAGAKKAEETERSRKRADFVQNGWGGGFDDMASKLGQGRSSRLVDVQAP